LPKLLSKMKIFWIYYFKQSFITQYFILTFLSFVIYNKINAQSTKVYDFMYEVYESKTMGTIEILKIDWETKKIFYSGSTQRNVPLKILNPEVEFLNFQKGTKVQFPNSNQIFKLYGVPSCANQIECRNPDGSLQIFQGRFDLTGGKGTFRCVNKDQTVEYLYVSYTNAKDLKVLYSSSVNPKWVTLRVQNIDFEPSVLAPYDDIYSFQVKFPNAPEVYKIFTGNYFYKHKKEPPQSKRGFPCIYVKNPDGSIQIFEWINKD